MNKTLEIKDVSCGYGKNAVVKGFSALFKSGEFVGILGANGSGKTTLLKAITGILPLMSGQVYYDGNTIKNLTRLDIAKNFAFVSQHKDGMFYKSTVLDIVTLGRLPHLKAFEWNLSKGHIDIVNQALAYTKTVSLKEREMHTLSGGENQRVFIAKALAQEPSVLILDEPTVHLDLGYSIEIFELISKIKKERKISVISVIHDINLACRFCDRIIMIKNGEKAHDGLVEEVITKDNIRSIFNVDVKILSSESGHSVRIGY